MSTRALLIPAVLALSHGAAAAQTGPMSAIDWLSDTVAQPIAAPPSGGQNDIAATARPEDVSVSPIGAPTLDSVGLFPSSDIGLPPTIWAASEADTVIRLLAGDWAGSLPAIRSLVRDLVLAEFDVPRDLEEGALLAARIDVLLQLGLLNEADALLTRSGAATPELFRRAFDVALLLGTEDAACDQLRAAPDISPSFQARIFCLARGGDWNAAALTLETGEALGYLDADTATLMAHFLDPELAENDGTPPIPDRPSPLIFRVVEAIGEPVTTTTLPRAYAHADLRRTTGWKAQLEAGERLARTGAIDANRLLGLYTERSPAASGGIWDRVAAIQALDAAIAGGNPDEIAAALTPAWRVMHSAGLELPFAELFAPALQTVPLPDEAAALARRIGFLADATGAATVEAAEPGLSILKGIARGDMAGVVPEGQAERAIVAAFRMSGVPERFADYVDQGLTGEAILRAARLLNDGIAGDWGALTDTLRLFRAVGLERTARRAALQILLIAEPA